MWSLVGQNIEYTPQTIAVAFNKKKPNPLGRGWQWPPPLWVDHFNSVIDLKANYNTQSYHNFDKFEIKTNLQSWRMLIVLRRNHLNPGLGQIDFQGNFFPHEYVGVSGKYMMWIYSGIWKKRHECLGVTTKKILPSSSQFRTWFYTPKKCVNITIEHHHPHPHLIHNQETLSFGTRTQAHQAGPGWMSFSLCAAWVYLIIMIMIIIIIVNKICVFPLILHSWREA